MLLLSGWDLLGWVIGISATAMAVTIFFLAVWALLKDSPRKK